MFPAVNHPPKSGADKDTQAKLAALLLDDSVQVLSSFELNQVASLSYNQITCGTIFDYLESILSQPVQNTPLTLQKSLVLLRHVLTYGADRVLKEATALRSYVDELQNYNTVLMAQQQQGMQALLSRIQGGAVDQGGPVREAAKGVVQLLTNPTLLEQERQNKADPNSLVPVGGDQIAFCSDNVRFRALQQRLDQERSMQTKSNLAKASQGHFGGGYAAQNGKSVVGAAHSLEEMMTRAQKEETKFSDDGTGQGYVAPTPELSFAVQQSPTRATPATVDSADLLAMDVPATTTTTAPAEADLLDFGAAPSTTTAAPTATAPTTDFLMGSGGSMMSPSQQTPDIFGGMPAPPPAPSLDIFAPSTAASGSMNAGVGTMSMPQQQQQPSFTASPTPPVGMMGGTSSGLLGTSGGVGSTGDRFAALDALADFSSSRHQPTAASSGNNILTTTSFPPAAGGMMSNNNMPGGFSHQPTQQPMSLTAPTSPSPHYATSLKVSASLLPTASNNNTDDSGFVMGGAAGTGLNPLGPAPSTAPPPPPPGTFY